VVSFAADEAWDALFGVKTTEAGTAGVALPSASFFVHLENEKQFIRLSSPTTFSLFNPQLNFETCISP
jgi:hypothetical protein